MIPGTRLIRRLVTTLVVLAVLFVGGNVVAARIAEGRIADAARVAFGLDQTPEVSIDAFPIILSIVNGELAGVSLRADDVTLDGLRIASLEASLRNLAVEGGLFGGGDLVVRVGEGAVTAEVTQKDVNRFLKRRNQNATVHLGRTTTRLEATRSFLGTDRHFEATGTFVIDGRILRFEPEEVTIDGEPPPPGLEGEARAQATVEVKLPKLPGGFVVDGIDTGARTATLRASATDKRLSLSG